MKRTPQITIDWLKSKKFIEEESSTDIHGKCTIYIKDTRWWRYQFDIYEDHMDICLSRWETGKDRDESEDMKDITELYNLQFAASTQELHSLMELAGYPIKP